MASTCATGNLVCILGKNFFMERTVKHWKRVPREVFELPPLELCKRHVDDVLKDIVSCQCWINSHTQ